MIWWAELAKVAGSVALYVATVPRLLAICEAKAETARLDAEHLRDGERTADDRPPGSA